MIQLLFWLFIWKGRTIINVVVVALTKSTVNVNLNIIGAGHLLDTNFNLKNELFEIINN